MNALLTNLMFSLALSNLMTSSFSFCSSNNTICLTYRNISAECISTLRLSISKSSFSILYLNNFSFSNFLFSNLIFSNLKSMKEHKDNIKNLNRKLKNNPNLHTPTRHITVQEWPKRHSFEFRGNYVFVQMLFYRP